MAGQKMQRLYRQTSITALMCGLAALPAAAQDQDQDQDSAGGFEEIVVTARRQAESLRDVPGTVNAYTADTIKSAGIERAEDFIGLTAGVSLIDSAEVGDTQVNIRGINGTRDAENSFAFVIDGVLYTNPAAFNREFTNLQQIEIFKGPQSAIYGRNAAAGAIIVTTNAPGNEFHGGVEASYGNNDSVDVVANIGGPIIEDKLFFQVGGDYRFTDGFYRNVFQDGEPIVDAFEGYNFNARLFFTPTENLNIDIKARYGEVDASAIAFNSTFNLPVFAEAADSPFAFEDPNDREFVFQPNIVSDNNQEAFEISGKFEYDLGGPTLTGWVLYSDIDNDFIADGTSAAFGFFNEDPACIESTATLNAAGVTLPPPQILGTTPVGIIFTPDLSGSFFGAYTPTTCDGLQEQLREQSDISAEIRFNSDPSLPLRWGFGAYYLNIDRQVGVSLNRDSGLEPIRGLFQASGPNQTAALVFDDFDTEVVAVFGNIEYDVTDRLNISFALRYDNENRSTSNLVPTDAISPVIDLDFDGVFDDPINPGLSPLVNPLGFIPDQQETFAELQPKIAVTWDVHETTTLFATWGVGFKAGGFNNAGSAATVDIFINSFINEVVDDFADQLGDSLPVVSDSFDQETSNSFELGFKSSFFDNRLQVEGAAYFTDVDNSQFFEFFVGTFGLLRVNTNIDDLEIYGFEIAASGQVTPWWTAFANFNYTESEIMENSSRPDTVGSTSPSTPDFTFNAGSQFDVPITDDILFQARIDVRVVGPTFFHTQQEGLTSTIFQPLFAMSIFGPDAGDLGIADFGIAERDTFATLNVRAGINWGRWSVFAFAQNLTETEFLEEIIPAPEFGGLFAAPGPLTSFGVEIGYQF